MTSLFQDLSPGDSPDDRIEAANEAFKIPSIPETLLVLFITIAFISVVTAVFFVMSFIFELDTNLILQLEAFIIIPAVIFGKIRGYSLKRIFRFNPVTRTQLFTTIVIGISLIIVINYFEYWLQNWQEAFPQAEWFREIKSNFEYGLLNSLTIDSMYQFITVSLAVVIFAAVCEEMLFRGFIQQTFENRLSLEWAVFLTAFLFTILHPFSLMPILVLAVILSIISWRSDSIFPTIIIHALNNGISLFALNSSEALHANPAQAISVPLFLFLISLVVLIFSMFYFVHITRVHREQTRD